MPLELSSSIGNPIGDGDGCLEAATDEGRKVIGTAEMGAADGLASESVSDEGCVLLNLGLSEIRISRTGSLLGSKGKSVASLEGRLDKIKDGAELSMRDGILLASIDGMELSVVVGRLVAN